MKPDDDRKGTRPTKRKPRNAVLPSAPDVCDVCNRRVGPRGVSIDGQARHAKCDREQRNN